MIETRSDVTVECLGQWGGDLDIARAAWISLGHDADQSADEPRIRGLLGYLMKHRHGSPFEHGILSLGIEAPIFVAREWMRHRIASYNEMSGRYTRLLPVFWLPDADRGLVNAGTSARPRLERGTDDQRRTANDALKAAYTGAWDAYQTMLAAGVANEVARAALPVGVYTAFRVTTNPRSLMNFLSLRVQDASAAYPTYPQAEIDGAARSVEAIFAQYWPLTHAAFVAEGRVAP